MTGHRNETLRRHAAAAAVAGLLAVALGAFGAHALQDFLAELPDGDKRSAWWQTAVRYHMWHALFLLGLGLLDGRARGSTLKLSGALCIAGIAVFSGSLYVMTVTGIRWLGAITPLGGLALMAAWGLCAVAVWRGPDGD